MCGIAGCAGKGDEETGRAMISTISYRGPDYIESVKKENVTLAHARLSIIDLNDAANQPMFNPEKSVAIVFNGEIYNYKTLRNELLETGKYKFRTTSDTEVLLYLYEELGIKMLDRLNGMFAFGIYDFKQKRLLLARDRMGKKPLYYGVFENTLVFGSELKAVLRHPSVKKELNTEALNQYLTFDYVPTPNSIIKGIFKLKPAHYLLWQNDEIKVNTSYWEHHFRTNSSISFPEATLKLGNLLNDATSSRLMSDVPLGVFLSGGLDSSTIAYYASRNATGRIKTFSIGFTDKSYDEATYAEIVAKHLGTEHYSATLTPAETLNLIPEIFPKLDEPFADASIIPTYFLSKYTREQVTVALGGDGSDELMAGYPTFISDYFIPYYHSLPQPLKKLFRYAINHIPVSDKNISFDFKLRQFSKGFESDRKHIHQLWLGSFTPREKKQLLNPDLFSSLKDKPGLSIIDYHYDSCPKADSFHRLLYYYYQTYLLDDILVKVDRASMYTSLEVRAPFLDRHVVEFLNTLPKAYKQKGLSGKYILKELMRDKLPSVIIDRPKKGFGIPLSYWLRHDLKPLCEDLLSKQEIRKQGLFNYEYVKRLKEEHYKVKRNHRKLLWNLMVFQLWWRNFYE